MQERMNAFWEVLGNRYCEEKGYIHITKHDKIDDETKQLHERTLVIINSDDSGSMFWNDYRTAIAGGKKFIEHLKEHHTNHELVQIQLWYNFCHGVSCNYKDKLSKPIPLDRWDSAHYGPIPANDRGYTRRDHGRGDTSIIHHFEKESAKYAG